MSNFVCHEKTHELSHVRLIKKKILSFEFDWKYECIDQSIMHRD